jgi:hypothetical protein
LRGLFHGSYAGSMKLFEAPAVKQALLEAQAALALARAQAGLQSWASARELEAAGRLEQPVSGLVRDIARTLQLRRALGLVEAEVFASAELLLALADAPACRPQRPWIAQGLDQLLGGIEPLRRAAAPRLRLPGGLGGAVAAALGGNLGLAPLGPGDADQALAQALVRIRAVAERLAGRAAPGSPPQTLPGQLAATHGALQQLRAALEDPSRDAQVLAGADGAPLEAAAAAEDLLAAWRHRLPHLQPRAYGHEDPRRPPDGGSKSPPDPGA